MESFKFNIQAKKNLVSYGFFNLKKLFQVITSSVSINSATCERNFYALAKLGYEYVKYATRYV